MLFILLLLSSVTAIEDYIIHLNPYMFPVSSSPYGQMAVSNVVYNFNGRTVNAERLHLLGIDVVRMEEDDAANLLNLPYIDAIEIDRKISISPPSDVLVQNINIMAIENIIDGWGFNNIRFTSEYNDLVGLVVGVLDSGVDINHKTFANKIWVNEMECPNYPNCIQNGIDEDGNGYVDDFYGWNFVENNNNVMDDGTHGTHCAGIISTVAPGVKIMPLRILSHYTGGAMSNVAKALNYALSKNIKLTSNSWGTIVDLDYIYNKSQDIIHVSASGNDGINYNDDTSIKIYPAYLNYIYKNIISVAAHDILNDSAEFSNIGSKTVDVSAPGVNILSSCKSNKYCYMSGTSMATPFVTGMVALTMMYVQKNNITQDINYQNLLINSSLLTTSLSSSTKSHGKVSMEKLFQLITPACLAISNEININLSATSFAYTMFPKLYLLTLLFIYYSF